MQELISTCLFILKKMKQSILLNSRFCVIFFIIIYNKYIGKILKIKNSKLKY